MSQKNLSESYSVALFGRDRRVHSEARARGRKRRVQSKEKGRGAKWRPTLGSPDFLP